MKSEKEKLPNPSPDEETYPTERRSIDVHGLGKTTIQEIPLLPWMDLQDAWGKWRGKEENKVIDKTAFVLICQTCQWGVVGWSDKDPVKDIGNVYKHETIMDIWSGVADLMNEEAESPN